MVVRLGDIGWWKWRKGGGKMMMVCGVCVKYRLMASTEVDCVQTVGSYLDAAAGPFVSFLGLFWLLLTYNCQGSRDRGSHQ